MNLRKDHSCDHAVKVMIGWRTEAKTVLSRLLCLSAQQSCILTDVMLHLATSFYTYLFMYENFQQQMSWFTCWWRVQRSAITIVNCRIPWINWPLNAEAPLGHSWGHACVSVLTMFGVCSLLEHGDCASNSGLMHQMLWLQCVEPGAWHCCTHLAAYSIWTWHQAK